MFGANVERLRSVLFDAVGGLPATSDRDCTCVHALDGIDTGITLP
ncbi:hypothetical protein NKH18_21730 [Streptomyces sp. M10(2022)]